MKARAFPKHGGFTLIELIVVVGIIAILAALIFPAISSVRRRGALSREISSARQLMNAYAAYAAENNTELLPGYGDFPAKDDRGEAVHNPVNARYPWRLAPYLKYEMRLFWGSEADDRIGKLAPGPHEAYVYAVSVEPALGINALFVGGDYQVLPPNKTKAQDLYGQFCVTRLVHAAMPHKLIVLASAGGSYNGERLSGYFKVEAPNFLARTWATKFTEPANPDDFGHVDFRWDGKALAAMLDGHVELLDFAQMNDMQRWSNQAATARNETWRLGNSDEPSPSSSGSSSSNSVTTGTHVDARPINTLP